MFLAQDAANPGRAGHRMAVAAEQLIDDVRLRLTRLFDGSDFRRMIFAMNCTDALNMAIKGVLGEVAGHHVVSTVLEHNSVSRPLQAMANSKQIELTRVDCNDEGIVDTDDIAAAIRQNTKLIVMTHASNVLGTIQDAKAIGAVARQHDVLFCLDAAQTAGVVPISIKDMQIDLLAFPGHKSLLGPTGIGGLYVGERCPEPSEKRGAGHMSPWREGGTGGDSSTTTQPVLYPYYLEGGTPNTVGVSGLAAGLKYLGQHPMADILAHERYMIQAVWDRFSEDQRFTIYGTPDPSKRVGTVALNIDGYESADAGAILDNSFNIAVRPGLHCAPYIHRRINTFPDGVVRISPGPFNTSEELDVLLDALDQIAT